MNEVKKTKSQEEAAKVVALFRARNSLVWIVTKEEARVESYIFDAAKAAKYTTRTWDVAQGFADIDGEPSEISGVEDIEETRDAGAALKVIKQQGDNVEEPTRNVWIMRDLPVWLAGPPGASPLRQLRNLARHLPTTPLESAQVVIVLSPSGEVPPELTNHATVIEWPLPDRAEIASILDGAIEALPEDLRATAAPNGQREAAIDAAIGLSGEEASGCYARSLVQLRKIDPTAVAKEKKRVISREKVLEWFDPIPGGLDAVGGLENLKEWLLSRSSAYSPKARAYGLQAPKGALLVGIPGCGKSLTAKAIATAYGVPLLRLDLGALKDKFVGGSEGNIRKAFRVIEAIGRCVVWIDEIEKAMQGSSSGSSDGGVSADQLGAVLSWMQDRQGEAFVIATANDVTSLPPELLRKGRFDEIWSIDLPNAAERVSILAATLRSFKRGDLKLDLGKVASACKDFTGSEIAAIVPDALFVAFSDSEREITTDDLVDAAGKVVPLIQTAKDKIEKLREWAKGRARPATAQVEKAAAQRGKVTLDVA